jgi:uncharacterized protein YbcI
MDFVKGVLGMNSSTQLDLLNLSSTFSKIIKRRFGKGPESSIIYLKKNRLYVFIRNFITPAEEVLIVNKEIGLATNFRSSVIKAVFEEFIPEASKVVGTEFYSYYHDWNYDKNTGVLLLEYPSSVKDEKVIEPDINHLLRLVEAVGSRIHKKPNNVKVILNTHNICVVEAIGVQSPIETVLFEKGKSELLGQQLRELKEQYKTSKNQFEMILNRKIDDIFILGDHKKDRYEIIFYMSRFHNDETQSKKRIISE